MYWKTVDKKYEIENVYRLWSSCCEETDFVYKALSQEEFEAKFFSEEPGIQKVTILHGSGDAFASGTYVDGESCAYITMVIVSAEKRRQGIGRAMVSALEQELKAQYPVKQLRIIFFNPVTLVWEIPGKPGCEHPNSPGVDKAAPAWSFFHACGYVNMADQNSYYLDLEQYELPQEIKDREEQLYLDGYAIRIYDSNTMTGMKEMVEGLGNSMWIRDILGETMKDGGGRPILVPVKDGRVLGFAGPLDVEPSGRGFFAGIAVDSAARGKGVAKVLFAALCVNLRKIGASYMTLFTGENNPARRIYEAAGFEIVRSWEDMKKDL